jgi:hypothetical protein
VFFPSLCLGNVCEAAIKVNDNSSLYLNTYRCANFVVLNEIIDERFMYSRKGCITETSNR